MTGIMGGGGGGGTEKIRMHFCNKIEREREREAGLFKKMYRRISVRPLLLQQLLLNVYTLKDFFHYNIFFNENEHVGCLAEFLDSTREVELFFWTL